MRLPVDGAKTIESFVSHTSVTFDPVAAAESAANLTLSVLFEPERVNRLNAYDARERSRPTLEEAIDAAMQPGRRWTASTLPSGAIPSDSSAQAQRQHPGSSEQTIAPQDGQQYGMNCRKRAQDDYTLNGAARGTTKSANSLGYVVVDNCTSL
jgi:hypothetical protein